MKKKKINLPLSYELQNSFDSERFLKVRIKVMHSGLNLNNSYFTSEVIEKAKPTLANVPILAFVKKEDGTSNDDFAGHEFEIKITEDDIKYVYLGRPIGIVPETNNYEVETDDDGKQFVVVDGYIWKQYANSALDIINRDEVKKVSMEVIVNDYDWEETYINILDYSYTGIAMLGENVREAMIGAKAEIINYSKNTISDMMFELKEALKGGQEKMENEKNLEINEEEITAHLSEEEEVEEVVEEMEVAEEVAEVEEEKETEETFEEAEETEEEKNTDSNFEAQIAELQAQLEELQTENARLAEFVNATQEKAKVDAIEEMFAKFEDLKEVKEAQTLREKAMDLKLSDLENQLFALRGKHMSYSVKDNKEETENDEPQKTDWKKLVTQYSVGESLTEPEWADLVRKAKKE